MAFNSRMAEWLKAYDLKSYPYRYLGSNPSSTIYVSVLEWSKRYDLDSYTIIVSRVQIPSLTFMLGWRNQVSQYSAKVSILWIWGFKSLS